jgi:hypothetical protein
MDDQDPAQNGSGKCPEIDARCGADTPQIDARYEADALPRRDTGRKRIDDRCRLLTLEGIDARTTSYRETRRLIDEIEQDLGGAENLSAAERQLVQHAAVLGAIAADLEAQYLKGRRIDVDGLVKVLHSQHRCFMAIGLRRRARDVTPPTLEHFLGSLKPEE